jgi:hypothetical protein
MRFFFIAAIILPVIIADRDRSRYLKSYIFLILAALVSAASVLPWFLQQMALQLSGQKLALIAKAVFAIPFIPLSTLGGTSLTKIIETEDLWGWNAIILLVLTVILGLTGIEVYKSFRKGRLKEYLNTVPLFLILLFTVAYVEHIVTGFRIPSLHPRYTIYFMMLLSGGLLCFTASSRSVRNTVFILLLSINVFGLFVNWWGKPDFYRIPWNKIASLIDDESAELSIVASSDNMHIFPLPYYMNRM